MYMKLSSKKIKINDFLEAKIRFKWYRDNTFGFDGTMGLGASECEEPIILNDDGEIIAHVSYNGRIWAGEPKNWNKSTREITLLMGVM